MASVEAVAVGLVNFGRNALLCFFFLFLVVFYVCVCVFEGECFKMQSNNLRLRS